jgi:hypothetical protein
VNQALGLKEFYENLRNFRAFSKEFENLVVTALPKFVKQIQKSKHVITARLLYLLKLSAGKGLILYDCL